MSETICTIIISLLYRSVNAASIYKNRRYTLVDTSDATRQLIEKRLNRIFAN